MTNSEYARRHHARAEWTMWCGHRLTLSPDDDVALWWQITPLRSAGATVCCERGDGGRVRAIIKQVMCQNGENAKESNNELWMTFIGEMPMRIIWVKFQLELPLTRVQSCRQSATFRDSRAMQIRTVSIDCLPNTLHCVCAARQIVNKKAAKA